MKTSENFSLYDVSGGYKRFFDGVSVEQKLTPCEHRKILNYVWLFFNIMLERIKQIFLLRSTIIPFKSQKNQDVSQKTPFFDSYFSCEGRSQLKRACKLPYLLVSIKVILTLNFLVSTEKSHILKQTCIWKQQVFFKYVRPFIGHQKLNI